MEDIENATLRFKIRIIHVLVLRQYKNHCIGLLVFETYTYRTVL